MNSESRQQIRLILEEADASARRAVTAHLQAIYRKHAAAGLLQSGGTVIAAVSAVERIGADLVTRFTDQIAPVAKDTEAFAMMQQTFENFLRFISTEVQDAAQKAGSVPQAATKLFEETRTHLLRQLEIQRFTFIVPQPSSIPPATTVPPPFTAQLKNRGGKPLADHWDRMWAAVAVMLYSGDLKPKTQADIERAMKDWLFANDFDVGDTAVRARARKLWQELVQSE